MPFPRALRVANDGDILRRYAQVKRKNIALQQRVDELEANIVEQDGTLKKQSGVVAQVRASACACRVFARKPSKR